jgi:subtilisin family serine protease
VWQLTNPAKDGDAFAQSRRLRKMVVAFPASNTPVLVPTVSPNHLSIVSAYDMCPDGPPRVAPERVRPKIPAYSPSKSVRVVVIDTGFIESKRHGNRELTQRGGITAEKGRWPDTSIRPAGPGTLTAMDRRRVWRLCGADDFVTYPDFPLGGPSRLAGVAGHGTFVTGILAASCEHAHITVVGHRHAVMPIPEGGGPINKVDKMRLFASEVEIAGSVLRHRHAQVINCGFAFPILDGLRPISFTMVLPRVKASTAILAPAGNEDTKSRYWPAADGRVIGVAATDKDGTAKADFSNWGDWIDCCSPGVDAVSTFGSVKAVPQDYPAVWGTPPSVFAGWALWNGTCFATPTVAARIATEVASRSVTPRQAWNDLRDGAPAIQFPEGAQCRFISAAVP